MSESNGGLVDIFDVVIMFLAGIPTIAIWLAVWVLLFLIVGDAP